MKKKFYLPLVLLVLSAQACKTDTSEFIDTAYSDIIAEIVTGYKTHWSEGSPEDLGLSYIYRYESEFGGFARMDINADGIDELLIGDAFPDGSYLLYDIFTFDKSSLDVVHLLSGGERDHFTLNGGGAIIENGSSSASDSFTKYFKIKGCALEETDCAEKDLMCPDFDKFLRYVSPGAYVAIKDGELKGQLVRTLDDAYIVEIQDQVNIPKDGVEIQYQSAYDAQGVVYPRRPGSFPVYGAPDTESEAAGEIIYDSGYVPGAFKCLGYAPGWFKIEFEGGEGYLEEEDFSWDFTNRF